MNFGTHELPEPPQQQYLDVSHEPSRVEVSLLDRDDLPLARGAAMLPLLLGIGVGVFWPSCPMPAASQLATAKCFALPTGEMMKLQSLKLFAEDPPRYEFRVSRSLEDEGIVVSE